MRLGPIKQRRTRLRLLTESDRIISINYDPDEQFQLAIGFVVTMSTTPSINRAQVQVQGLNRKTRDEIAGVINGVIDLKNEFITLPGQDPPIVTGQDLFPDAIAKNETIRNGHAFVELDVGYSPDQMSRVFEGSSHWARHQKNGPVWTTNIDVGDGLSTRLGGVAARRFDPGATVFDVVRFIVRSMGLGPGNLTPATLKEARGFNRGSEVPDGQIVTGDLLPILNALFTGTLGEWWVDRGHFWVSRKGEPLDGIPIVVSFDNGLRFDPQPAEGGLVLLNSWHRSDARIGRPVRVEANILSGEYRIEKVIHRGSNLGGDYQTQMLVSRRNTIQTLGGIEIESA